MGRKINDNEDVDDEVKDNSNVLSSTGDGFRQVRWRLGGMMSHEVEGGTEVGIETRGQCMWCLNGAPRGRTAGKEFSIHPHT